MVTYLWKKDDESYVGLNGQIYSSEPTGNDLLVLQNYAENFVGEENAYMEAFRNNVAGILGVPASGYTEYYNSDSSCIPGYIGIKTVYITDGSGVHIETSEEITEDGKILVFRFYNLKGDCGDCSIDEGDVHYGYLNEEPHSGLVPHSAYTEGDNWFGIYVGSDPEKIMDAEYYAWTNLTPKSGVSTFTEYVFKRQASTPATPSGGTFDNPIPSGGWSDSVPNDSTAPIWMSMATFRSDMPNQPYKDWSVPARMSDSSTFQSEWAVSSTLTDATYAAQNLPPIDEGETIEAWEARVRAQYGEWTDSAFNATYMAWANCNNGVWEPWTIAKIKGENGRDGNGGRTFMIFCALPEGVTPQAPTQTAIWDMVNNVLVPSTITGQTSSGTTEWSTSETAGEGEIAWLSQGSFDNNGNMVGTWATPIRITGADGENGKDGNSREYIYTRFNTIEDYYTYTGSTEIQDLPGWTQSRDGKTPQDDDFVPYSPSWVQTWTDTPEGIDEGHMVEICAFRDKTNDVWGYFSTPFIWAQRGEDGIDGDGVEYIFRITDTAIEEEKTGLGYQFIENPTPEEINACTLHPVQSVPEDRDVTSDDPDYIECTGCTGENQYYKKISYKIVDYTYPYDEAPEVPPQSLSMVGTGITQSLYGPYYDGTHINLTTEQIETLNAYYQTSEFIPNMDKINVDITDPESEFHGEDFLTEWGNYDTPQWTDNPSDVSMEKPYEWVCVRKFRNGTWEPFSKPILWARFAKDGEDGKSLGQQFIYYGTLTPTKQGYVTSKVLTESGHGYVQGDSVLDAAYSESTFTDDNWVPQGWSREPLGIYGGVYNFIWTYIFWKSFNFFSFFFFCFLPIKFTFFKPSIRFHYFLSKVNQISIYF